VKEDKNDGNYSVDAKSGKKTTENAEKTRKDTISKQDSALFRAFRG
jgi:hypothetical protein